ncbi:hypothetical protein [Paraburkholderia sp.]|uniref:hypothetical protein n=1 Tax=Paraburkholderia sp. TaxID=1926495 RepID=UPI00262EF818|nr:hypothetical protein [Paraburkholderia sp.]
MVEPLSVTALAALEVVPAVSVELPEEVWPPPPPQAPDNAARNKTAPKKQRENNERMVYLVRFFYSVACAAAYRAPQM